MEINDPIFSIGVGKLFNRCEGEREGRREGVGHVLAVLRIHCCIWPPPFPFGKRRRKAHQRSNSNASR